MVHKLGKDPDAGRHEPGRRHDEDWPHGHEIMRGVRRVLEEYDGDRVAVGEVYVLDQRRARAASSPAATSCTWPTTSSSCAAVGAADFRAVIDEFERAGRAPPAWPAWCLENHDHSRVATRYDEGGRGPRAPGRR